MGASIEFTASVRLPSCGSYRQVNGIAPSHVAYDSSFTYDARAAKSLMGTEAKTEVHPRGLYLIKGVGAVHTRVTQID
jgi:hypothetical protein